METAKEKTKDKKRKKKPRKRAGGPKLPIYRCKGHIFNPTCMRMCTNPEDVCNPAPMET